MRQILLALAIFLAYPLAAQNLRITNAVPFGASSLKIVFSNDIDSLSLAPIKLNQNSFYIDIKAVLDIGRKVYFFPRNAQVTIAQNTPEITRIVITNGNGMEYQLKPMQKNLYLSFVDKIPSSTTQSATQPKTESKTPNKPPQTKQAQTIQAKQAPKQPESKPVQNQKPQKKEAQKNDSAKNDSKKSAQKPKNTKSTPKPAPKPATKSTPKAPPPRTIVSTTLATPSSRKGLKVVIDAGHGGKDCGAFGVTKVCEKHIVLKVALKVHNELKKRGYESYLTRDRDVFIELPERTKFANAKKADLFISIHANSVPVGKKSPRGIETYFLSAARTEDARSVAAKENQADIEIMNFYSKQNFLDRLESHRIVSSNRFAIDIQTGLIQNLQANYPPSTIVDNGVREGPFWVLVGALMPSVLVEIGYNSHPLEAQRLNEDTYQKVLSLGIADGIDSFVAKNFKE